MPDENDFADVLLIGAGASGGAFAWSLAEAGINVVCLEQGGWVPANLFPVSEPDAQLHMQTDFHPDPSIRRLPEDYPVNDTETPIAPLMYNAVGGSLIHWGSHFPRFHPSDFRVKTLDNVADDWPLTYAELEPYYDLNDRMIVAELLQLLRAERGNRDSYLLQVLLSSLRGNNDLFQYRGSQGFRTRNNGCTGGRSDGNTQLVSQFHTHGKHQANCEK